MRWAGASRASGSRRLARLKTLTTATTVATTAHEHATSLGWGGFFTLLFAAIAAVAALGTVWQTRAGERRRRLSEVADAVAALDQADNPYAASRVRLRAALLPVPDALPVCHALARMDRQTVERWITNEDTPGVWNSQNANLIVRTVMRAAERELEAALLTPSWRTPLRRPRAPVGALDAQVVAMREFLFRTPPELDSDRSLSDALVDEGADFLVPRDS